MFKNPANPVTPRHDLPPRPDSSLRISLAYLAILAFAIKLLFLLLDPSPQFFLGDSGSYIYTALTGWIPPDRSYLYGYLIRWLSVSSGSLFSLVLAQALMSAVSAAILGWILLRFIKVSPAIALVMTVCYCAEPLQLMYERFVMAETFSLTSGMLFVSFIFLFLDTGRNRFLVLASVAGIVAVALRISFLPLVTALSFSAPFIHFFLGQTGKAKLHFRVLFTSLAVVAISYLTLHSSYRLLTGRLSNRPPAYQYADGLSLLSSWCPVLTPDDLKAEGVAGQVLNGTYERTFESRRAQRWMENGIAAALNRSYKDPVEANYVAKKISLHILRRDPLGVAALALHTYLNGWQRAVISRFIKEDCGDRAIPPDLVQKTARDFHIAAAAMPTQRTLTKTWYAYGTEWYRVLLLSPLLLLVTMFFCDQSRRPFLLLVTIYAAVTIFTVAGLTVDNSIRYLHSLSWTVFVLAAYWIDILAQRICFNHEGLRRRLAPVLVCCCVFSVTLSPWTASGADTGPKGLYVRDGVLMREGRPYRGIGANYNTVFGKLLQNKDDKSSLNKLALLGKAGIPFVRFRASGFGPENQQLYLQDRPEFFRRMDQVIQCAEQNGIGLIPSLFWRLATVSELVGENRDQLGNPASRSNQFIREFTQEMVLRYKDSPAIWGWEFGNEANLAVDLPGAGGRRPAATLFGWAAKPRGDARLTSQQLCTAYALFAETVRKIDPSRIIEPGTALPRTSAWHLAHGQTWQHDSLEQFLSTLPDLTPDPMDMISVHVYAKAKSLYPVRANSTEGILGLLMKEAAEAGKPLFLGEFPVRDPIQAEEFLHAIEVNRVPLSAFWVFDYPQEPSMSVDFDNQRSFALDLVAKANRVLQANN